MSSSARTLLLLTVRARTVMIRVCIVTAIVLSVLTLSGCPSTPTRVAAGPTDGIGGTGIRPGESDTDGLGGTGIAAAPDPGDGIGGTGIYGAVSSLSPLSVAGVPVSVDGHTQLFVNGEPALPVELSLGRVVSVLASSVPGGGPAAQLLAKRIDVADLLVGPLDSLDAGRREIRVLGQVVRLPLGAVVMSPEGRFIGLSQIPKTSTVRISGFGARDGTIRASQIQWLRGAATSLVSGPIEAVAQGQVKVRGLWVRVDEHGPLPLSMRRVGVPVALSGRKSGLEFVASSVHMADALNVEGPISRLVVEGFASLEPTTGHLLIGGYDLNLAQSAQIEGDAAALRGNADVFARASASRDTKNSFELEALIVNDGLKPPGRIDLSPVPALPGLPPKRIDVVPPAPLPRLPVSKDPQIRLPAQRDFPPVRVKPRPPLPPIIRDSTSTRIDAPSAVLSAPGGVTP